MKSYQSPGYRVFDLAQPLFTGMPCSPNHPGFRMALHRRHGDHTREDGTSGSSEIVIMGGHVGTHMDGLAHVSHNGRLFGGIDALEAQRGGAYSDLGIETVPPLIGRGALLDVAKHKGVKHLPGGDPVSESDLSATARTFNVDLDGVNFFLVRTGWPIFFSDSEAFVGRSSGVPGVDESGAEWLASHNPVAVGSDTIAFEQVLPGAGHARMPVHRRLLVEQGIHIVEVLNLEELSSASVYEFELLLAPLKFVGATGAPVRPVAWVTVD